MTLLLLIAIAWVAVAAFFVTLCRMAGRGDEALAQSALGGDHPFLPGLVLWRDAPELAARDLRSTAASARERSSVATGRPRSTARS